jgi:hypothetical protein
MTSYAGPRKTAVLRLSIVIPCAERIERFEDTLVSVLQNRPKDCEVLVVQPRPYDDPYDLCGEVRFVEAVRSSSLVDLINVGVRASRSRIVHLLSCDTQVESGWSDAVLSHFDDERIGSVSPLLVQHGDQNRIVTTGVDFGVGGELIHRNQSVARDQIQRRRTLGPTLHAAYYRRQAIIDAGCFCSEAGPQLAHVDMAIQLRSLGLRHVVETESAVSTARRLKHPLSLRDGKQVERLFWQHASSRGLLSSLVAHPAAVAAETFRNIYRPAIALQLLGRLLALVELVQGKRKKSEAKEPTVLKYDSSDQGDSQPSRHRRAA